MRQTERGTIKKGGQRKRDRGVCFCLFLFFSFFLSYFYESEGVFQMWLSQNKTKNKTKQ